MIIKLKENESDLVDLVDTINECMSKLSFLVEFFAYGCPEPGSNLEINERGTIGIHLILQEIEEELNLVADELNHKMKKDPEVGKKRAAAE